MTTLGFQGLATGLALAGAGLLALLLIRGGGRGAATNSALMVRHATVFAVIYNERLGAVVSADCSLIAGLWTTLVTAASDEVPFHLIDPLRENEMRVALEAFDTRRPHAAQFVVFPCL